MLARSTISAFLEKMGHTDPTFYYRTKTVYKNDSKVVYLFFVPSCVVIATAEARRPDKENLDPLETVAYKDLAFTREDSMYVGMKWETQFLLIGFKDEVNMNRFCSKIKGLGMKVRTRGVKRVVGNDEGESVSYKLENESIDHVSTDTAYEVFSIDDEAKLEERDRLEREKRNNKTRESKMKKGKLYHTDRNDKTNKNTQITKGSKQDHFDGKERAGKSSHDSKYAKNHQEHAEIPAQADKSGFLKNSGSDYDLINAYKNKSLIDESSHKRQESSKINECLKIKRKSRAQRDHKADAEEQHTSRKHAMIKSQIEFGDLNFFVLTEPTYKIFCRRVMIRLCEHFDTKSTQKEKCKYSIDLNEHFLLFVRSGGRFFKLDNENDFQAATCCLNSQLDVVVRSKN